MQGPPAGHRVRRRLNDPDRLRSRRLDPRERHPQQPPPDAQVVGRAAALGDPRHGARGAHPRRSPGPAHRPAAARCGAPRAAGPARPRSWGAAPPGGRGGSRCRRGRGRRPASTARRSAPAPGAGAARWCGPPGRCRATPPAAVGDSGETHRSPERADRPRPGRQVASWPCRGPTSACAISCRIVSRTSSSEWTAVSGALSPSVLVGEAADPGPPLGVVVGDLPVVEAVHLQEVFGHREGVAQVHASTLRRTTDTDPRGAPAPPRIAA